MIHSRENYLCAWEECVCQPLGVVFCTPVGSLYPSREFKSSASLLVFVYLIYLLLKVRHSRILLLWYCLFLPCYQLVFSQYIYMLHMLERDLHTEVSTLYMCVFVFVYTVFMWVCICIYHICQIYTYIYF